LGSSNQSLPSDLGISLMSTDMCHMLVWTLGSVSLCAGLSKKEKGLDNVNDVIQVVNSSGFIGSTFIPKVNSVLFRLACIKIFNNLFASYLLFYLMDSGQV